MLRRPLELRQRDRSYLHMLTEDFEDKSAADGLSRRQAAPDNSAASVYIVANKPV